jgi:predicted kinase
MDAAGNVDRTRTQELRITDTLFNPVDPTEVTVSATLPADLPAGAPSPVSEIQVYDTLGTLRTVRLTWTRDALNEWTLGVAVPDDIADADRGTIALAFGDASANPVPDGTIGDFGAVTGPGALTGSAYAPGSGEPVFAAITAGARSALAGGHAVIADTMFAEPAHRTAIAAAAGTAPFLGLWLEAPLPVLEARLAARAGDASDATVAVLRRSAAQVVPAADWHHIDTTDGEAAVAQVMALIAAC